MHKKKLLYSKSAQNGSGRKEPVTSLFFLTEKKKYLKTD